MHRISSKLTYANVMATIALFIALGGAGYATVKLPKDSVGAKQIKNNAITGAKIKDAAVTGVKIASGTLGGVPASAYTRSGCGALTGQIKGFARINDVAVSTTGFSTAGVETPYNCSGREVLAWRFSAGKYEVRFEESPVGFAFATPMEASGSTSVAVNSASINGRSAGEFIVQLWNEVKSEFIDGSFTILTP